MRQATAAHLQNLRATVVILCLMPGLVAPADETTATVENASLFLPTEYWEASFPPDMWNEPRSEAASVPMDEVNWDDAVAVEIHELQNNQPPRYDPFKVYHYRGAGYAAPSQWIIGKGDELGIFSLQFLSGSGTLLGSGGLDLDGAVHFISGPVRTDLPPRVYDLTLGVPYRGTIGDSWTFDVMFRVGWFSDFEGSAREGLRFPSHLVLYRKTTPWWQWVLGVDFLDRNDFLLLPVLGAVWTPQEHWRLEAVFPRPLIGRRFQGGRWVYVAAQMGGGTWDIQRSWGEGDVFTYRDLQLLLGIQNPGLGIERFVEVGYVFQRHLEYRSGSPSYNPPEAVLLRAVVRY
jgi:hypothetical protein